MNDREALRISILSTYRVNVGDEFIREGVLEIFDLIGRPCTPLPINKYDPTSLVWSIADEVVHVGYVGAHKKAD
jgi:hypothetical protein